MSLTIENGTAHIRVRTVYSDKHAQKRTGRHSSIIHHSTGENKKLFLIDVPSEFIASLAGYFQMHGQVKRKR